MKQCLRLFLSGALIVILSDSALCRDSIIVEGGINRKQPISIGEVIYEEKVKVGNPAFSFYQVKYSYLGIKDNNLKIRYEYVEGDILGEEQASQERAILLVPLNKYGTAYFKTYDLPQRSKEPVIASKKLVIAINNKESGNIVVEEFDEERGNPGF